MSCRDATAINALIAADNRVHVADLRGPALSPIRGGLADDWVHPDDVGYTRIANLFQAPGRAAALLPGRARVNQHTPRAAHGSAG
ncbi:hypothetical protein [Amycolatopsis sp. NPDC004625]|uniref:hypothetical protein n=1 Tax=Amycolatopsis sp. NPDC004625 TaxID=3154670 RepID=UPI0033AA7195